jgi:hypothetical protein
VTVNWVQERRRRRSAPDPLLAVMVNGIPVVPAAYPSGTACSCDRVGCPAPGMHPVSYAWQGQASTEPQQLAYWRERMPDANYVSPTGRGHDVLDLPASAGTRALVLLDAADEATGPVVICGDRYLFFTLARGSFLDDADLDDEWWPCELDCHPESVADHPGLRWHNRGSYVLVPPSRLPSGGGVRWVRGPELPLPDPLRLLDALTTACEELGDELAGTAWPYR